jgi:F0F1-type ATP synthase assembly protein I
MIQSLFNHDDDDEKPQPPENKSEIETEESIKRQLDELNFSAQTPAADDEIETVILPRIDEVYSSATEPTADKTFSENRFSEAETQAQTTAAESLPGETEPVTQASTATPYRNVLQNETAPTNEGFSQTGSVFQTENVSPTETKPLTTAETIRQSGMAWSAAVGLFASVLFMMILGWFFDLLTGASPIGLVVGIIIGAGLGFYQFFRITSQIFKKD